MTSTIDRIPFSSHLGMALQSAADGRSSCSVPLQPEFLNSGGVAHGGLTFALADTCMGQALRTVLATGERGMTLESKINYLRAGTGAALRSESQVVHRGRSFANIECRIWAGDVLVATATGTFAIRRPAADPQA